MDGFVTGMLVGIFATLIVYVIVRCIYMNDLEDRVSELEDWREGGKPAP